MAEEKALKEAIINTGKKIYDLRLVAAHSGNLSARLDENEILITATGSSLGDLKEDEIIMVDLTKALDMNKERLSSEFPLHRLIYQNFPAKVVIHCHPSLINGYFAVFSDIKALTFETRLYLGNVPVVNQETPAITKPELVIEALKNNNLAVIKNHGVVAMGQDFNQALGLIEMLEEAVKVAAIARIFKKEALDEMETALKDNLASNDTAYPMFSKEHIQAIVDLVNKDDFIAQKGKELDLTLKLAIKLDDTNQAYKFNFEKGKIVKLDADSNAPFIISAARPVWEQVFLGKLDSFVAVTQGKMKLQGQLGQLSKWYVPFSRLFELFKQVKFK
jgi:L-fuculose-phosphate aldolase